MDFPVLPQQLLFESARLFETAARDASLLQSLQEVAAASVRCLKAGGKILIAGNGGSAAESTHLAGELVGPFLDRKRPGLAAIPLGFDTGSLTAIGNDLGFERIYARQLEALGREGDLFWALTSTGNSHNIVLALQQARAMKIGTVLFANENGGKARPWADYFLHTPPAPTARVQELHLAYGHWLCQCIESAMSTNRV